MTGSVLGKRTRDSHDTEVPARSTRSKKRAVALDNASCTGKLQSVASEVAISTARNAVDRSSVSPLKRIKQTDVIEIWQDETAVTTPKTPRHRDALAKTVAITPRHRFAAQVTPRTPSRTSTAVYNQARELFSRSSNPRKLTGRDDERAHLQTFVQQHVDSGSGGCLYVSGPPGTGKSALIDEVLSKTSELTQATVNCMALRNGNELLKRLAVEFSVAAPTWTDFYALLSHSQYLLVLDEIDRLVEVDLDLLYELVEQAIKPHSKLILIGIANALDLTDRCLPKLRNRGLKPQLLPFMPYTAPQIVNVLTTKLASLGEHLESGMPPFLHPAAIQFCAKKVAAQTGDLRKAFDICHRAIDLIESETIERDTKLCSSPSKTPLMEKINLSSPLSPPETPAKKNEPRIYTIATAPKATIAHMAKITAQVFSNGTSQRLAHLNLQQKAVLCTLSALEKKRRSADVERSIFQTPTKSAREAPSVKQLYDSYTLLCKQSEMLHPLSALEFRDVVSGLEAQSLVTGVEKGGSFATPITPSRTPSRKIKAGFIGMAFGDERRVAPVVGHKELEAALQGAGADLLKDILSGAC